jgi:hypothetical protein
MRADDLTNKLQDRPFRPFRIHLSDGGRLDVTDPGMFIIGENTAVLPSVWGKDDEGRRFARNWRTIDFAHIVQFGDIDETIENKRRRRK